jgi:hypothetical protein
VPLNQVGDFKPLVGAISSHNLYILLCARLVAMIINVALEVQRSRHFIDDDPSVLGTKPSTVFTNKACGLHHYSWWQRYGKDLSASLVCTSASARCVTQVPQLLHDHRLFRFHFSGHAFVQKADTRAWSRNGFNESRCTRTRRCIMHRG